jgi:hypothetical protein
MTFRSDLTMKLSRSKFIWQYFCMGRKDSWHLAERHESSLMPEQGDKQWLRLQGPGHDLEASVLTYW